MLVSVNAWRLVSCLVLLLFAARLDAQSLRQEFPAQFSIRVTNSLGQERSGVLVHLPEDKLQSQQPAFNPKAFVVLDGKTEIASQYNEGNAQEAGIVLVLDQLGANASKTLTVRYNPKGEKTRSYPKRTQAELSHKVGGYFENHK